MDALAICQEHSMPNAPSELVEISKLNGDFRRNYGKLIGAFVSRFISILKSAPAAHVVNQEMSKVGSAARHVVNQFAQPLSVPDPEPTFAFVPIGTYDCEAVPLSVSRDDNDLVLD